MFQPLELKEILARFFRQAQLCKKDWNRSYYNSR